MTLTEHEFIRDAWRATPDSMMAALSNGALIPPAHLQLLGYLFYLSATGYMPRMAVSMPPGHAKSTLARWACAWALAHNPKTKIIYASYGQRLAEESGKAIRQILMDNDAVLPVHLRPGSRAADRWSTTADGGLLAGAVRSGVTGFRASMAIIDDPHKDWAEATSEFFTAGIWDWYRSVILTRLIPKSPVIIIQTRWSVHDLIARVMGEAGECKACPKGNYDRCKHWCFVRLPAVAEEDETIETVLGEHTVTRLRAQGIPLPEWHRAEGEPLWPNVYVAETNEYVNHYDAEEMEQKRLDVGPIVWQGLYQQRPPAEGGKIFRADKWRYVEEAPMEKLQLIRWWDTAATEAKVSGKKKSDPDWTAGVLMGRDVETGYIYVLDVVRFRAEPQETENRMRHTVLNDLLEWKCNRQGLNQDPAAAGKFSAAYLTRTVFAGVHVEAELESGDKYQRALPYAAQQARGNVFLVCGVGTMYQPEGKPLLDKAHWINEYVQEHTAFNDGAHDDQVDASSTAFAKLAGVGRQRAKIIV